MRPNAVLISKPQFDMPLLISLCNEILGYSPIRAADNLSLKDQTQLLACLAAFRDKNRAATVKAARDVYNLLYHGFLIVSDEQIMPQILEILGGIPFVFTETKIRGVHAIIAVGTFYFWRNAILRGCRNDQSEEIRACFNSMFLQFQKIGLADAFGKLVKRPMPDKTFLLEDQR